MKSIFVVGDSISIQYGPYLKTYLNGKFNYSRKSGEEEALKNLDIPQGANGGDSKMVLDFLTAQFANDGIKTDYLLVNCGLHDIKTDPETGEKQIVLEEYKQNLQAIIDLTKANSTQLIWLRTTPCYEEIHNKKQSGFHRFHKDVLSYNEAA